MKRIFFCLLCLLPIIVYAYEKRDLLQKSTNVASLQKQLIPNQKWVPYPTYTDRNGWDKLVGDSKQVLISKGESALKYQWQVITASEYLEYDLSGSRKVMQDPYWANNEAIADLVLAELAEGKGRFLRKIADGIWFYCEMTSWAESAHVSREQKKKTSLPCYNEDIIDLTAGDMGSFFAWTYFFLKEELDKIQPLISERLRDNLQRRIIDAYLQRNTFWWQMFDYKPGTLVNNWTPWCNFNVLCCLLLVENNSTQLAKAVYRTMISVDQYLNYIKADGACEEGTVYWSHAAGKLYDYLKILQLATDGAVSLFSLPMIRNMGEYIVRSYIGNGWVVNFSDASAKGNSEAGLIFNFGKAIQSSDMQKFGAYLMQTKSPKNYYVTERDIFSMLESIAAHNTIKEITSTISQPFVTWYPQTEVCYLRNNNNLFLAAKGGNNNESHNHNDVGSCIFFINQIPILIDAGVGIYTRQTFSNERYSIWTMQSDYHNLPIINGISQSSGAEFQAKGVQLLTSTQRFSLDIGGAYPPKAAVEQWKRIYQLGTDELIITDKFRLKKKILPNKINFLVCIPPDISTKGIVSFVKDTMHAKLSYNSSLLTPNVDTIPLNDKRLSDVWGNKIYRLTLTEKKQTLTGKHTITIKKMP